MFNWSIFIYQSPSIQWRMTVKHDYKKNRSNQSISIGNYPFRKNTFRIFHFDKIMKTSNLLTPHKIILQRFGIWSLEPNTIYSYLHFASFFFTALAFIATLFTSILFVGSMKQAVDNLIVSSSTVLALIKGIIFYCNHSKHIQIYEMIEQLDNEINPNSHDELTLMNRVKRFATMLFRAYAICYMVAWLALAIQSVFESSEKVFWSSTTLYPGEFWQNRIIYWTVFAFQAFTNLALVVLVFIVDTYGIVVIIISNGYIDIVSKRLRNLGSNQTKENESGEKSPSKQTVHASFELKDCVKKLHICTR